MGIKQIIVLFSISLKMLAQQGAPIGDVATLSKQKKYFCETYQGVFKNEEINRIEKINAKHSKIYYTRNKVNFEAVVNSDRNEMLLVVNCQQIPIDKLPPIVKDAFHRSKYGKLKIEKAFIAANDMSADFYRIDVLVNSKSKSLFYTDLGAGMESPY